MDYFNFLWHAVTTYLPGTIGGPATTHLFAEMTLSNGRAAQKE